MTLPAEISSVVPPIILNFTRSKYKRSKTKPFQ
jgi:hypothetical protein